MLDLTGAPPCTPWSPWLCVSPFTQSATFSMLVHVFSFWGPHPCSPAPPLLQLKSCSVGCHLVSSLSLQPSQVLWRTGLDAYLFTTQRNFSTKLALWRNLELTGSANSGEQSFEVALEWSVHRKPLLRCTSALDKEPSCGWFWATGLQLTVFDGFSHSLAWTAFRLPPA